MSYSVDNFSNYSMDTYLAVIHQEKIIRLIDQKYRALYRELTSLEESQSKIDKEFALLKEPEASIFLDKTFKKADALIQQIDALEKIGGYGEVSPIK